MHKHKIWQEECSARTYVADKKSLNKPISKKSNKVEGRQAVSQLFVAGLWYLSPASTDDELPRAWCMQSWFRVCYFWTGYSTTRNLNYNISLDTDSKLTAFSAFIAFG
jgi:hypothetical protein